MNVCMICNKTLNHGNAEALSPLCRICQARYATPRRLICYYSHINGKETFKRPGGDHEQ